YPHHHDRGRRHQRRPSGQLHDARHRQRRVTECVQPRVERWLRDYRQPAQRFHPAVLRRIGMVRARVVASAFGTLALVSMLAAPAPRAALAANSAGIAFEVPSVVDPMHAMGEPDIGVDPLGRVFSSGPTGTGTQRSLWYGSVDKGHTYRQINPGTPPTALSGTKDAPGGGDTDIAFDRNSKQYFSDLYALTCLRTATTNDGGATANQQVYPAGCSGVPGADRQWLAGFDPSPAPRTNTKSAYLKAGGPTPLIYMEYNTLTNGAHWVKSNSNTVPQVPGDPGLTY